jgi:hypothetical protein
MGWDGEIDLIPVFNNQKCTRILGRCWWRRRNIFKSFLRLWSSGAGRSWVGKGRRGHKLGKEQKHGMK